MEANSRHTYCGEHLELDLEFEEDMTEWENILWEELITKTAEPHVMEKAVLVSYLDRNKVIKIPLYKPPDLSDLQYIKSEFKTCFSFQPSVKLNLCYFSTF